MDKDKVISAAQSYVQKGQVRKAIAEYERVVKVDPADNRARLKLADLYMRQGDTSNAVDTLTEVAKRYESDGFALKAVAVYKQLNRICPGQSAMHLALAQNYCQLGLINDARAQYSQAMDAMNGDQDGLARLRVAGQLLDLEPDNLRDRIRLAEAYAAMGQLKSAVREFRKVAQALEGTEYTEDFRRVGERLLYHQPDDNGMARKLAESYALSGQPEQALPKLKMAFRNAPRDLEVLGTCADVFEQIGQAHKAVTVLKEMARLYDRSGLEEERDDCFSRILSLSPDDSDAARLVEAGEGSQAAELIEFDGAGDVPVNGGDSAAETDFGPRPPEPSGEVAVQSEESVKDDAASETERLIDEMIRQASTGDASDEAAEHGAEMAEPAASQGSRLRDLFDEALAELSREPVTKAGTVAEEPPEIDGDSRNHGEEEEIGFDDGHVDQTLVDNQFIPDQVLDDVGQAPIMQVPGASEENADEALPFEKELNELDAYIESGLTEEANGLLEELKGRWGDHEALVQRASRMETLNG